MLKFKLIEETKEVVTYKYFPEGGTDSGVVSYDKKTKEFSIVTLSVVDKHQRYAQKMFAKIREYANNNTFRSDGVISWG